MKILVLGAGRMGHGAVFDLVNNSPDVTGVTVADFDLKKAEAVAEAVDPARVTPHHIDAGNQSDAARLMRGHDSAVSCVNYWLNERLARAAIEAGTNFCDLGGNNDIVDAERPSIRGAKGAGINIIPDCGLAPGMVSFRRPCMGREFEPSTVHIRVGGLPQAPGRRSIISLCFRSRA